MVQRRLGPTRLVFVDEIWAKTRMAPLKDSAPVGQRLHAKILYGHWKTMTLSAALRCNSINMPLVFGQPINGATFTQWFEQKLCPRLGLGDIVVLDSLSSHKKSAVRAAIRAKHAFRSARPATPTLTTSNRSLHNSSTCCGRARSEARANMAAHRLSARCFLPAGMCWLPQNSGHAPI